MRLPVERRLSALERRASALERQFAESKARLYVLEAPDGMDAGEAMAAAGVNAGEGDLAVVIARFGEACEPRLLSTSRMAGGGRKPSEAGF
jgi:hypothetical protein